MHTTLTNGASAIFTFTGSSFTVYFQKGYKFGTLKVYVDRNYVGSISQNALVSQWQVTKVFSGLGAGNHTVQFIASGGKTTIDAILIP